MYKNIYGTLGIHPHETKNHVDVDKKRLLELKGRNKKIIGGFNLKIGDKMMDCTVSSRINDLRKKLINN